MQALFKSKPKSPTELVRALKESLTAIEKIDDDPKRLAKHQEDVARYLHGQFYILESSLRSIV